MADDETKSGDQLASDTPGDLVAAFEEAAASEPKVHYVLTLYVTGMRPKQAQPQPASA